MSDPPASVRRDRGGSDRRRWEDLEDGRGSARHDASGVGAVRRREGGRRGRRDTELIRRIRDDPAERDDPDEYTTDDAGPWRGEVRGVDDDAGNGDRFDAADTGTGDEGTGDEGTGDDGTDEVVDDDADDETGDRFDADHVHGHSRATRYRRYPGRGAPPRVVWRIGTGAAAVLAAVAAVLVVRAVLVPAATEISVTPVPVAGQSTAPTSAGSSRGVAAPGGAGPSVPAGGTGPPDEGGPSASPASGAASAPPSSAGASGTGVVVHVAGAVRHPGVVRLPSGSRVADALTAAGGALPGARVDAVNLAAPAQDGTQIRVPDAGEAAATVPAPGTVATSPTGPVGAGSGGTGATDAGSGAGNAAAGPPVDLNTADAAALDALPRVGPVMAERIVAWRTEHGPFGSVDDLDAVPGIGEKMMAELRPLVSVR